MQVEELRNYGQPQTIFETRVPQEVMQAVEKASFEVMAKHLGEDQLEQFASAMAEEQERLLQMPLTTIREHEWGSDAFVAARVEAAASYSALSQMVGTEKALEILVEVAQATAPLVTPHLYPTVEDFLSFADPFAAFKKWFISLYEADRQIGAYDYDLVEDTDDAFEVDVTLCAAYEAHRQLGMADACRAECYAGSAVVRSMCDAMHVRYVKSGLLPEGAAVCDYRFERVKD